MASSRKQKATPECPVALKTAWAKRKLVLFLGAGVSQPYGLPSWNELVLNVLLDESSHAFDVFWPHYRVALASWLTETFGFSGVVMARLARQYARERNYDNRQFQEYLRSLLYRPNQKIKPAAATTLTGVVDLLKASEGDAKGWHIPAVVTFNYDDLLEQQLKRAGIACESVYSNVRRTEDKLYVLHVHGFLPQRGSISEREIVFTEDEYHRLSFAAFHWAQVDMINLLRNYTVLFLGLSMTDPNLRRLLDASRAQETEAQHFVIRKSYSLTPAERERARQTIKEKARAQEERFGLAGVEKTEYLLDQAIDQMLRVAADYDADVLRDMGVETVWVEDFAHIPALLASIPQKRPGKRRAARQA